MTLLSTQHSPLQIQSLQLAAVEFGQIEDRSTQRRFPPKDIESTIKVIQSTFRSQSRNALAAALKNLCRFGNSRGARNLFETTRASVLFYQKFWLQFDVLRKRDFFLIPLSITFLNPKI